MVSRGQTIGYTLSYTNKAPAGATMANGTQISDILPSDVTVDPATISNGGVLIGDIQMRTNQFNRIAVAVDDRVSDRMYVLYPSVRQHYPKFDFEIHLLFNSSSRRFDIRAPVVGVNTIPEGLQRQIFLFRIESKQWVYSGRTIRPFSTPHVPGPTACTTQALGLGQISFATSQFSLRVPYHRDIRYSARKLNVT